MFQNFFLIVCEFFGYLFCVVCCLDYFTWLIALVNSCFVLVLVWCSLFAIPCPNFCCSSLNNVVSLAWWCCSIVLLLLLNIVVPPCSMLLFFFVWHCCSMFNANVPLIQCYCSLFNDVVLLFVHLQHDLFKYLFATPMMLLFFTPYSTLLLLNRQWCSFAHSSSMWFA